MSKGAAIITGATGAIGKDISLGLAAEGYDIVLHYSKNKEKAEQIREHLGTLPMPHPSHRLYGLHK